jgi:hypothetical protein
MATTIPYEATAWKLLPSEAISMTLPGVSTGTL